MRFSIVVLSRSRIPSFISGITSDVKIVEESGINKVLEDIKGELVVIAEDGGYLNNRLIEEMAKYMRGNTAAVSAYTHLNFTGDLLDRRVEEVKFVSSPLILYSLKALRDVGGFDGDLHGVSRDLDVSLRLRLKGYKLFSLRRFREFHPPKGSAGLFKKISSLFHGNPPTSHELWGIEIEGWEGSPRYRVSIVIPVYNNLNYTKICLDSLSKSTYIPYELIIVDNGSTDGTEGFLKERGLSCIRFKENKGFSAAINAGIRESSGDYVVILNNDTFLSKGWLDGLLKVAEMDINIGLVGPMTNYAAGYQGLKRVDYKDPFKEDYEEFVKKWREKNRGMVTLVSKLSFFCVLIKKQVFEKIGYLDEKFWPGGFEDDDFSLRSLIAGYRLAVARDVFIHHFGEKTLKAVSSDRDYLRNWKYFMKKWGIRGDELITKRDSIGYDTRKILRRILWRKS